MNFSPITELTMEEVNQVNGGIVPFILAVVAIDAGLQAAMWGTYVSKYG